MPKIPEAIGKYKVEALVAQGGMGAVYKALHPTLKRPVIIKRLTLLGKKDITERFKREARILMDLKQDNIVSMYDHFREGNSFFLVLEYVDGISLEQILKKNRYLPSGVAAYILLELAKALDYAHRQKVIHRDIKPGNVLISRNGRVKLVDFGIAAIDGESEEALTREGMTLGTPSYMPQEQFENSSSVDHRADIYSLGILAYEMLTGKKPYSGSFSPELLAKIQKGKYVKAKKINPDIHSVLGRFIAKAMRSKKETRYQDLNPVIKLLTALQARWDVSELKRLCATAAHGKEIGGPTIVNPKKRVFYWYLFGFGVIALAGLVFFAVQFQTFRALLSPKTYGALVLTVTASEEHKQVFERPLEINLFNDDDDKIPSWEGPRLFFYTNRENGEISKTNLKVFVPAGAYRAKINTGREVFWTSFAVEPWAVQRGKNKKAAVVEFKIPNVKPRSLEVHFETVDGITGKSLNSAASIFVLQANKWVTLEAAKDLRTGTILKVRVEAPGYNEKLFSVRINNEQDILFFRAGLLPK